MTIIHILDRTIKRPVKPGYAGRAGMVASFAIAFAGVLIGAISAYLSERGAASTAARAPIETEIFEIDP